MIVILIIVVFIVVVTLCIGLFSIFNKRFLIEFKSFYKAMKAPIEKDKSCTIIIHVFTNEKD